MTKRKFSVILGGDGIGKSATIRCMLKLEKDIDIVHWRQVITQDLWPYDENVDPGKVIDNWSPEYRSLALTTLSNMVYSQGVLTSIKSFVLVDSYYYRFFGKEKLFAKCSPAFFSEISALPLPFQAIVFYSNPSLAWSRKRGQVDRYEYFSKSTFSDFCEFQDRVQEQYVQLLEQQNIPITWLNPEDSIKYNAKKIIQFIKKEEG